MAEQPGGELAPAIPKTGGCDGEIPGCEDSLQKFASVHASIYNHFNLDRHPNRRAIFRQDRSAALAEWRQLRPEAPVRLVVSSPHQAEVRRLGPRQQRRSQRGGYGPGARPSWRPRRGGPPLGTAAIGLGARSSPRSEAGLPVRWIQSVADGGQKRLS